jgi:hypothetical protein
MIRVWTLLSFERDPLWGVGARLFQREPDRRFAAWQRFEMGNKWGAYNVRMLRGGGRCGNTSVERVPGAAQASRLCLRLIVRGTGGSPVPTLESVCGAGAVLVATQIRIE